VTGARRGAGGGAGAPARAPLGGAARSCAAVGALEGRGGTPAGPSPGLGVRPPAASVPGRLELVVPAGGAGVRLDRFLAGVAAAPGARRGTVVNALAHRLGTLAGVGRPDRPGIVHRLDRDTSGVLLVARTAPALEALARQFRTRTVQKVYLAVVRGHLGPVSGTIDRAVGRHPRERKRMSVHSRRGRAALTRWTALERFPGATLMRLEPETGRTHQLRVHLAAVGHPIVGDRVYGPRHAGRTAGGLAGSPSRARPSTPPRSASTTPRAGPAWWSVPRFRQTWSSSSLGCAKPAAARRNRAVPLDSPGPIAYSSVYPSPPRFPQTARGARSFRRAFRRFAVSRRERITAPMQSALAGRNRP